jgi:hypothetical protein
VEQALRGLPGAAEAPSSRPELLPAPPARFVRRQLRVLLAEALVHVWTSGNRGQRREATIVPRSER